MTADPAKDLRVGIIGAGAMGQGIAQVALMGRMQVVVLDNNQKALTTAGKTVEARLVRLVEKGQLDRQQLANMVPQLHLGAGYEDLSGCDVVIEAIYENVEAKLQVLEEIERVVAETCIIATNTSSISIAKLANVLAKKARFAGLHFFNPVPLMKLVEVVKGPETSPETMNFLDALGKRFGRTPVAVKDGPGFLVNLGGRAYTTEALAILQEGVASRAQIDAVMRECCGFRMGPFELMDLTGMDVNYPVTKIVYEGYGHDARLRTTPFHQTLFEAGLWGRKTGHGHFHYEDGKKVEQDTEDFVPGCAPAEKCFLVEPSAGLEEFCRTAGLEIAPVDDGQLPLLAAPLGEDATAFGLRCGIDHKRLVTVDLLADTDKRVTLMMAPGADADLGEKIAAAIANSGRRVTAIKDSTGFIAQRMCAVVANLGCEMAQNNLAAPEGIDLAMRLGLNYPRGPLELADFLGAKNILEILTRMQALSGDDRYRPSPWLRRRADLGMSMLVGGYS